MATISTHHEQYTRLKSHLLSISHTFLSLPTSPVPPHIPQTTGSSTLPTISSLSLHPTIESLLHLLNADLPSAHFLLRHAQAPPAYECMYLHGILHRIEGDVENARCWYGDVKESDVLKSVWGDRGGEEGWRAFLGRAEWVKERRAGRSKGEKDSEEEKVDWRKEEEELMETSLWELKTVLGFLERKFGTEEVREATKVWVQPDKTHADKANAMIVGGEGWREF